MSERGWSRRWSWTIHRSVQTGADTSAASPVGSLFSHAGQVRPGWEVGDNLLTIVAVVQRDGGEQERIATMRNRLVVVTLALALAGCASTTTTSPPVASPTSAAAATTTAAPTTSAPTSSSAKASTSGSFDTLPAGYSYAYLYKLTKVSGRWSVVLDPVTMCMYPSTDPNCKDLTEPPPNDYELRNLNAKTYTVPLATGTILTVVGPSGQPTDYVTVPMAEKSWPTASTAGELIVTYSSNAAGEVSAIKEWWHP